MSPTLAVVLVAWFLLTAAAWRTLAEVGVRQRLADIRSGDRKL